YHRHIRIMVFHLRPALAYQVHQYVARRFAFIINVRFVSQANHQNLGTIESLPLRVEGICDTIENVLWHSGVDLASQLDEAGTLTKFTCLPGKVERIDWNAMSAKPRTGIKWHEAEGLGLRRFDNFPNID